MKTYIYALKDPRDNTIRYVGKADNPEIRFRRHLSLKTHQKTTYRQCWIKSLRNLGLSPELEILEECGDNWQDRERFWIAYCRESVGEKLTNLTEGGEGIVGLCHTPEARQKMRNARLGKIPWNLGKPVSEETKFRIRKAVAKTFNPGRYQVGHSVSQEVRSKMSASLTGRKNPKSASAAQNIKAGWQLRKEIISELVLEFRNTWLKPEDQVFVI